MSLSRDPGRTAGLWYLLLILAGPLPLIYIPAIIADGGPAAMAANIVSHELLFRLGMADEVVIALILVFLVMALYRLFEAVDHTLAVLVVIFGGVMPATIHIVSTVSDAAALMLVQDADLPGVFTGPQRDALARLFLGLHGRQYVSAEALWGIWLFPLAMLVWRLGFVPRLLGIWLAVNGFAYLIVSFTGLLLPRFQDRVFSISAPARLGELAFMLWLVIRGARPPAPVAKSAPR